MSAPIIAFRQPDEPRWPYTPSIEARWNPHRAEYERNRFIWLSDIPKAVILGMTLVCLALIVAVGIGAAVVGWMFDASEGRR